MSTPDTAQQAVFPHARLAVLGLLTIVAYGSWFYGFGVLIDDIAADLGGALFPLTTGYAIAQVSTGVLGVIAGRLLDRSGARAPFAIGAVLGPTLLILASRATDPWVFSLTFGAGGGVVGATAFYHLTQTVAARLAVGAEVRAIARLTIWGAFASPVLIPLTEVVRAWVGWRDTVAAMAVAVAIVLVLAAVTVDRDGHTASPQRSAHPWRAVRVALADRRVRRFAISAMAGSFGASVLLVLQVPVMVAGGLERSTAAGLAGARGLAQLLGRLPLGLVLRRMPARTALLGARCAVGLGALLLAFSSTVPIAVLFVIVAGIGIGAVSPLEGIAAREVLPLEDLGILMGSLHLLLGIAAGLGPVLAGLLIDVSGVIWTGLLLAATASFVGAGFLRAGADQP